MSNSIVRNGKLPETLSHSGAIAAVIRHFGGASSDIGTNFAASAPNVSGMPSSAKKMFQTVLENRLSLINFAPFCTITCESGTAQPADILTQGLFLVLLDG